MTIKSSLAEVMQHAFGESNIRSTVVDGVVWFVAKDLVKALHNRTWRSHHVAHIPEEMKGAQPMCGNLSDGRVQVRNVLCLNQQGVDYYLVRSDSPRAEPMRLWLVNEVLPSIREDGGYIDGQENMTPEEVREVGAEVVKRIALAREGLRKQQSSFDDVIAKAYNEGTFKSPSVGLAIANANKIPSIVVLGNQPSTIEKNTGYRPRDLLVITEDAVGLSKYTEAVGQVKLLASMGFDAKAIRSMVCSLH